METDSTLGDIIDWGVAILVALIIGYLFRTYCFELFVVDGSSMRPTLQTTERVIVDKFSYRFLSQPKRGDVVVFRYPSDTSRDFIKRVIGLPGDVVEISRGEVYVNHRKLDEDYILNITADGFPQAVVPQGTLFVLGDNRNDSEDSRFSSVGFVPLNLVLGQAVATAWPFHDVRKLTLPDTTTIRQIR